jgi:hypothetical protein
MTLTTNAQAAIIRTERGLIIAGTRITIYDVVEAQYQEVLQTAEEIRRFWEERNRDRLAQIAAMPPKPGQEALWKNIENYMGVGRISIP